MTNIVITESMARMFLKGIEAKSQDRHLAAAAGELHAPTSGLDKRVFLILNQFEDGLTSMELAKLMPDVPYQSVTPRFRPLARKGLIFPTSKRRVNPTGARAIVWKTKLWLKPSEMVFAVKAYCELHAPTWESCYSKWLRDLRHLIQLMANDPDQYNREVAKRLYRSMYRDVFGELPKAM